MDRTTIVIDAMALPLTKANCPWLRPAWLTRSRPDWLSPGPTWALSHTSRIAKVCKKRLNSDGAKLITERKKRKQKTQQKMYITGHNSRTWMPLVCLPLISLHSIRMQHDCDSKNPHDPTAENSCPTRQERIRSAQRDNLSIKRKKTRELEERVWCGALTLWENIMEDEPDATAPACTQSLIRLSEQLPLAPPLTRRPVEQL